MLGVLRGHLLLEILEPLVNLATLKNITQQPHHERTQTSPRRGVPPLHPTHEDKSRGRAQGIDDRTWRRRSTSSLQECLKSPRSSSTAGKTGGAAPSTGGGGGGAPGASSPRNSGSSSSTRVPNSASNEKSPWAHTQWHQHTPQTPPPPHQIAGGWDGGELFSP